MGTFQARAVLFAFLGLAAYICYNALYLQEGPHPSPLTADVDILSTGSTNAAIKSRKTPARRKLVYGAGQSADAETVRAVQRELAARGFEPGPADGVHGLFTRAAVMAFQHDGGLAVTGEISDELLKQILLGSAGLKPTTPDKVEVPEETTALIKAVQQILAKMGYDPGPIDGIVGSGTRQAIRTFEQEQKMPAKGRISGALLARLIKVTGAKLANIPSG